MQQDKAGNVSSSRRPKARVKEETSASGEEADNVSSSRRPKARVKEEMRTTGEDEKGENARRGRPRSCKKGRTDSSREEEKAETASPRGSTSTEKGKRISRAKNQMAKEASQASPKRSEPQSRGGSRTPREKGERGSSTSSGTLRGGKGGKRIVLTVGRVRVKVEPGEDTPHVRTKLENIKRAAHQEKEKRIRESEEGAHDEEDRLKEAQRMKRRKTLGKEEREQAGEKKKRVGSTTDSSSSSIMIAMKRTVMKRTEQGREEKGPTGGTGSSSCTSSSGSMKIIRRTGKMTEERGEEKKARGGSTGDSSASSSIKMVKRIKKKVGEEKKARGGSTSSSASSRSMKVIKRTKKKIKDAVEKKGRGGSTGSSSSTSNIKMMKKNKKMPHHDAQNSRGWAINELQLQRFCNFLFQQVATQNRHITYTKDEAQGRHTTEPEEQAQAAELEEGPQQQRRKAHTTSSKIPSALKDFKKQKLFRSIPKEEREQFDAFLRNHNIHPHNGTGMKDCVAYMPLYSVFGVHERYIMERIYETIPPDDPRAQVQAMFAFTVNRRKQIFEVVLDEWKKWDNIRFEQMFDPRPENEAYQALYKRFRTMHHSGRQLGPESGTFLHVPKFTKEEETCTPITITYKKGSLSMKSSTEERHNVLQNALKEIRFEKKSGRVKIVRRNTIFSKKGICEKHYLRSASVVPYSPRKKKLEDITATQQSKESDGATTEEGDEAHEDENDSFCRPQNVDAWCGNRNPLGPLHEAASRAPNAPLKLVFQEKSDYPEWLLRRMKEFAELGGDAYDYLQAHPEAKGMDVAKFIEGQNDKKRLAVGKYFEKVFTISLHLRFPEREMVKDECQVGPTNAAFALRDLLFSGVTPKDDCAVVLKDHLLPALNAKEDIKFAARVAKEQATKYAQVHSKTFIGKLMEHVKGDGFEAGDVQVNLCEWWKCVRGPKKPKRKNGPQMRTAMAKKSALKKMGMKAKRVITAVQKRRNSIPLASRGNPPEKKKLLLKARVRKDMGRHAVEASKKSGANKGEDSTATTASRMRVDREERIENTNPMKTMAMKTMKENPGEMKKREAPKQRNKNGEEASKSGTGSSGEGSNQEKEGGKRNEEKQKGGMKWRANIELSDDTNESPKRPPLNGIPKEYVDQSMKTMKQMKQRKQNHGEMRNKRRDSTPESKGEAGGKDAQAVTNKRDKRTGGVTEKDHAEAKQLLMKAMKEKHSKERNGGGKSEEDRKMLLSKQAVAPTTDDDVDGENTGQAETKGSQPRPPAASSEEILPQLPQSPSKKEMKMRTQKQQGDKNAKGRPVKGKNNGEEACRYVRDTNNGKREDQKDEGQNVARNGDAEHGLDNKEEADEGDKKGNAGVIEGNDQTDAPKRASTITIDLSDVSNESMTAEPMKKIKRGPKPRNNSGEEAGNGNAPKNALRATNGGQVNKEDGRENQKQNGDLPERKPENQKDSRKECDDKIKCEKKGKGGVMKKARVNTDESGQTNKPGLSSSARIDLSDESLTSSIHPMKKGKNSSETDGERKKRGPKPKNKNVEDESIKGDETDEKLMAMNSRIIEKPRMSNEEDLCSDEIGNTKVNDQPPVRFLHPPIDLSSDESMNRMKLDKQESRRDGVSPFTRKRGAAQPKSKNDGKASSGAMIQEKREKEKTEKKTEKKVREEKFRIDDTHTSSDADSESSWGHSSSLENLFQEECAKRDKNTTSSPTTQAMKSRTEKQEEGTKRQARRIPQHEHKGEEAQSPRRGRSGGGSTDEEKEVAVDPHGAKNGHDKYETDTDDVDGGLPELTKKKITVPPARWFHVGGGKKTMKQAKEPYERNESYEVRAELPVTRAPKHIGDQSNMKLMNPMKEATKMKEKLVEKHARSGSTPSKSKDIDRLSTNTENSDEGRNEEKCEKSAAGQKHARNARIVKNEEDGKDALCRGEGKDALRGKREMKASYTQKKEQQQQQKEEECSKKSLSRIESKKRSAICIDISGQSMDYTGLKEMKSRRSNPASQEPEKGEEAGGEKALEMNQKDSKIDESHKADKGLKRQHTDDFLTCEEDNSEEEMR